MDWSLLTCARKGHVTYAPDERPLRERLVVSSSVGDAWRCLRCGAYVHGEPHGSGPADRAPLVKRGKELRDAFIMRFFAVERLIRGLIVAVAAYGVWRFAQSRGSIQEVFEKEIPLLRPIARQFGWDLDHSKIITSIRHVFGLEERTLRWLAIGLLVYAAIEIIEAVGLWLLQRWGEYFAVVATCFGLPVEIYELSEKVTVLRIGALAINIGLIVYIIVTKRLFGVRGGRAAHEAHLRSESLLEVEHAAADPDVARTSRPAAGSPG